MSPRVIKSLKQWSWFLLLVILSIAFAFHFFITFLYNAPQNELKRPIQPLVKQYMEPLLYQNFKLFAPNPVSSNRVLYVRGIYREGGSLQRTEWVNLSKPVIDAVHSNRLSSQQYIKTAMYHAMNNILNAYYKDQEDFRNRYKAFNDPKKMPSSLILLQRLASNELAESKENLHFSGIELRIEEQKFSSYNNRHKAGTTNIVKLPEIPYMTQNKEG